MRRRTVLRTASVALAAALLGGCSAGNEDTALPATEVTQGVEDAAEPEAAEPEAAEPMLPAPTGPVYQVTDDQHDHPFELQGIGTKVYPQVFGEPAPAGSVYYVIATRIRPVLSDRDTVLPSAYLLKVEWPDADCAEEFRAGNGFACDSEMLDFFTGYLPIEASVFDDPGRLGPGDTIAPGSQHNVVFKALVPEDADLSQARMRWVYGDGALPVGSLPELPWP